MPCPYPHFWLFLLENFAYKMRANRHGIGRLVPFIRRGDETCTPRTGWKMVTPTLDAVDWAQEQFGECELGDKRRAKRLSKLAAQVAQNPSGSFPEQTGSWRDVKAAYRLFDEEEVTFDAVVTPHWQYSRAHSPNVGLVLCDTSELDFGIHREIENLSFTGNGGGWGFLLHSALLVDAHSDGIVGLLGQKIHYRKKRPRNENTAQRLKRERESGIWGKVCDVVGPPPEGVQWIHVCDRGADNFEVLLHFPQNRVDWVVRAAQLGRKILDPQGQECLLRDHLKVLPQAGFFELELRARPGRKARTAKLAVSFGEIQMPQPRHKSPYIKEHSQGPLRMWVIHVREVNTPAGEKPLEWVLYTSLPINNFEDAIKIIGYYEKRWLIEEWHKALKTGCQVTHRQLKTKERLEPMTGLMGVVAVWLLQMKAAARTEPERPALELVPTIWVGLLCANCNGRWTPEELTVGQFYREVAKLGGFLGRKGDGEPGWITIWRGWEKLQLMLRGYKFYKRAQKLRDKCG